MSLTIYQQSKAFISLTRLPIIRCIATTGICTACYKGGKQLSKAENRFKTYGKILKRYGWVCGGIYWAHILVTAGGALYLAKVKNFPRALYLHRGYIYGEKMGFWSMLVYFIAKESSGREWFAQIGTASYTGLQYGILQGLRRMEALRSFKTGVYGGIAFFCVYSFFVWMSDLYQILRDPNVKYSEWHNFDIEHYTLERVSRFFNIDGWLHYLEHRDLKKQIILCRNEMNELERLMIEAGITKDDLLYVDWDKTNEIMFDVVEKAQTGRRDFDQIDRKQATQVDTFFRSLDPHYKYEYDKDGKLRDKPMF